MSERDALAVRNCWLTSSFSSIATPSLTGIESGSNITNRLPLIRFHPPANDFQQIDSNPARRAGSSEHMLVKEGGVVPVQKRTMATTSTRKEPAGQFNLGEEENKQRRRQTNVHVKFSSRGNLPDLFSVLLSVSEMELLSVRNCWWSPSLSSIATPSLTKCQSGSNINNMFTLVRFHQFT